MSDRWFVSLGWGGGKEVSGRWFGPLCRICHGSKYSSHFHTLRAAATLPLIFAEPTASVRFVFDPRGGQSAPQIKLTAVEPPLTSCDTRGGVPSHLSTQPCKTTLFFFSFFF